MSTAIRLMHSDLFDSESLIDEDLREVRDRVAEFNLRYSAPGAARRWAKAEMDPALLPHLAQLGVVGGSVKGYGCSGLGEVAEGIVACELAKADLGVSGFYGIQSSLTMRAIAGLGSEEQKQRWLPRMAALEIVGALGVTEPDHGSDTSAIETSATVDGVDVVLNGRKKWIGNASIADVVVVFAKDERGALGAYVVEPETAGYSAVPLADKTSFRSAWPAEVSLDNVRIPRENVLGGSRDGGQVATVLDGIRPIAAWQALGLAIGAFEAVVDYLGQREQFGRPLTHFQLVQEKLADMACRISAMRLACIQISRLLESGGMSSANAAAAKRSCARDARAVVAQARDLMGGNGVLSDYVVARHFADAEAVFTYDGTDHIQSLLIGRFITGKSAIRG